MTVTILWENDEIDVKIFSKDEWNEFYFTNFKKIKQVLSGDKRHDIRRIAR